MNIKEKAAYFELLGGRSGISELIMKEVWQFAKDKTYKRAVRLAGKLRLLAELCEADEYWKEKMLMGYNDMVSFCEWKVVKGEGDNNGKDE